MRRSLRLVTQASIATPVGAETALPAAAARVARLTLTDFRNYRRATIEVDDRPIVLVGPNGAGKTNLLEAISLLVPGRGIRHARLGDIGRRQTRSDRFGGDAEIDGEVAAWGVAATVLRPDGPAVRIGTGRDPEAPLAGGRERRLVKIDDVAVGPSALADVLAILWLTPQMDSLFLDGASARRRFVDRMLAGVDPAHAGRLGRYEHALQERGRLLREFGAARADAAWLAVLEQEIAERAIAITAARCAFVAQLGRALAAGVGPFPSAGLRLTGEVETWLAAMPALAAEDEIRRRLAADRPQDAASGGAACGPHRSDVVVTHLANRMPAADCSTGEQKALLIAIVLAHARLQATLRGTAPALLLDEVAAHLDAGRRRALFQEVLSIGGQVLLTGTDAAAFGELRQAAQFFAVRDAVVTPE